jgi:hypothetical protein
MILIHTQPAHMIQQAYSFHRAGRLLHFHIYDWHCSIQAVSLLVAQEAVHDQETLQDY